MWTRNPFIQNSVTFVQSKFDLIIGYRNIMNLTLDVNIEQLVARLKLLPANQIADIIAELKKSIKDNTAKGNSDFQEFLLKGPVMSDDQYEVFIENRKLMNKWRSR